MASVFVEILYLNFREASGGKVTMDGTSVTSDISLHLIRTHISIYQNFFFRDLFILKELQKRKDRETISQLLVHGPEDYIASAGTY